MTSIAFNRLPIALQNTSSVLAPTIALSKPVPFGLPQLDKVNPNGNLQKTPVENSSKAKNFSEVSLGQLRQVNSNIDISSKKIFAVTDDLVRMFDNTGFVKRDVKSDALTTTKAINLGDGVVLPIGTVIKNKIIRDNGNHYDFGNDLLSFTTPNGKVITFTAAQNRKTGAPVTKMEMYDKKLDSTKSMTFKGAPFFNIKSGTLAVVSNSAMLNGGKATLYRDLMGRTTSALAEKQLGIEQSSTIADVKKFFSSFR